MQFTEYKNRLSKAKKLIFEHVSEQKLGSAALIISSSANMQSSRDQDFPYRQNSDLLYFTGNGDLENAVILISSELPRPVIIAKSRSKEQVVWDGEGVNLKKLASSVDCDLVDSDRSESEVLNRLKGIDLLFHNNQQNSLGLKIAQTILAMPVHQRLSYPKRLLNAEILMERLRLYKSPYEVERIEKANAVSNAALLCALPFISPGKTEAAVAATVEYAMKLQSAETAFSTIVASGKNAAVLHHRASNAVLKQSQLLLIDWGARLDGYCSDISRTFVIGGTFSALQKELHDVVLSAQLAAIRKVKHGVLVKSVYEAALRELAAGLKDLGIIKQPVSRIIDKKLYLPYFPHGIGHTLGIDTHDIGQMRSVQNSTLAKGMIITIEPGLYFRQNSSKVKACGVRIEDNLLVQQSGSKILSEGFPKKVSEIEGLF